MLIVPHSTNPEVVVGPAPRPGTNKAGSYCRPDELGEWGGVGEVLCVESCCYCTALHCTATVTVMYCHCHCHCWCKAPGSDFYFPVWIVSRMANPWPKQITSLFLFFAATPVQVTCQPSCRFSSAVIEETPRRAEWKQTSQIQISTSHSRATCNRMYG